jgi:hypothetical protein
MTGTDQTWRAWAPPLDPPDEGGLPVDQAERIALANPRASSHLIAAMLWEAYAAQLPPAPRVIAATTGAQSVQYSQPGDPFALAMDRASWHRSFLGDLVSVPLTIDRGHVRPVDWWQRNLEHPV